MPLSTVEVQDWLEKHIPHRIRASLAITKSLENHIGQLPQWPPNSREAQIARRCETDAIWEGRIIAMRWLVELVGLTQDSRGNTIPKTRKFPTDLLIEDLPGGTPISPASAEAIILSKVWKGSTQATSHPTHASAHPPINEAELGEALKVIVDDLNRTLYSPPPKDVMTISLVPSG